MKKILVIEDEQTLREDILEILEFENFQTIGAENGTIGVQLARAERPDLIICDIMMPELDGYGVLIDLHSEPSTANIPFIFLTAKTGRSEMRRGMELGADDYLTKPFTQPELIAAIKARFDKQANIVSAYEERLTNLRSNVVRALPHELRTPLTGIMGYSNMLIEDIQSLDTAEIMQMAEAIERAAKRLHRLTENYLLYAQIEFLQLDQPRLEALHKTYTQSAEQVMMSMANHVAKEHKRSEDLVCNFESNANVQIAHDSLQKIVMEIVDNAFKFSSIGSKVEVTGSHEKSFYVVRIKDKGRGITAEQIKEIGAYMQFDRRIYEQTGVGLGLIIAKRLLEVHQGQFDIASQPHQGSTISLFIPNIAEGITT